MKLGLLMVGCLGTRNVLSVPGHRLEVKDAHAQGQLGLFGPSDIIGLSSHAFGLMKQRLGPY